MERCAQTGGKGKKIALGSSMVARVPNILRIHDGEVAVQAAGGVKTKLLLGNKWEPSGKMLRYQEKEGCKSMLCF